VIRRRVLPSLLSLALLPALLIPLPARADEQDEIAAQAIARRGLLALSSWDVEAASAALEELLLRYPSSPEVAFLKGRVLFEQGRYDEAARVMQGAAAEAGDSEGMAAEHLRLARAAAEEVRGGETTESAHFRFTAKAEKDRLLAPYALATLEEAFGALTADLGYSPQDKVRVEVYDSPQALARVSPLTVADIKGSGTIALCKYNRLMFTSPRALLRGYGWLDTISHEFVHYLVTRRGRNRVPIWLQEGLAKFLETRWRGPAGASGGEFQDRMLSSAARENRLIPFAAMHPSIAKLPTQEQAALAFAEVEAAIRLLYARGGQQALTELVAAMASGMTDEQAVAQAYGKPFRDFEADWRKDVSRPRGEAGRAGSKSKGDGRGEVAMGGHRKLVFKDDVRPKKEGGSPLGDDGPGAEPKNPRARKAAHLGDLLFARGRFAGAAAEYGRARKLSDPAGEDDPRLLRRLGFCELRQGRLMQALSALERAVAADAEDPTAQVLFAQALLASGQHGRARAALEAAVGQDPFDPQLHAVWLQLARAEKDAPTATREERALALLSGRPNLGHSAQQAAPAPREPGKEASP
jgi:predicted Zn-dependent protease